MYTKVNLIFPFLLAVFLKPKLPNRDKSWLYLSLHRKSKT